MQYTLIKYSMELTDEEKEILEGNKGETLKKAMESIVMYGEAFGAKRLVKVDASPHLVTSFGIPILKPVFRIMNELIDSGLSVSQKFTVNPRPVDFENVKCSILEKIVFKLIYGKQKYYEEQLKKVGLKDSDAFSCTCYMPEIGNIPEKGQMLSWAESSAVVYANSVLGARTNRNSGLIELLCAIVGRAPEFGLLTDDGRKADWLIELKTSKLPNAHLLGSAIGMKVIEEVPYISGLDNYLKSTSDQKTLDFLKNMGAASASNGAVGLYHVEGVTPEAKDLKRKLLKENYKTYIIDDAELERVRSSYPMLWKNADVKPYMCFIGCPHLSLNQVYEWTDAISTGLSKSGRHKATVSTVLCAAPGVIKKFKSDEEAYGKLQSTGVKMTYICPLMYMDNPLCSNHPVITNSNKLRTYSTARFYTDEEILNIITGRH